MTTVHLRRRTRTLRGSLGRKYDPHPLSMFIVVWWRPARSSQPRKKGSCVLPGSPAARTEGIVLLLLPPLIGLQPPRLHRHGSKFDL